MGFTLILYIKQMKLTELGNHLPKATKPTDPPLLRNLLWFILLPLLSFSPSYMLFLVILYVYMQIGVIDGLSTF